MIKEYKYQWSGISTLGKKMSGTLIAKNKLYVSVKLKRQGIKPLRIHKSFRLYNDKITTHDITIFYRQLSTLLCAGIPLVQAMLALETAQQKSSMKSLITNIKNEVSAGKSLAHVFYQFPGYFNEFSRHLIHLGEQTGNLDHALLRAANHAEKIRALRKQIIQALLYPAIISCVAILVTLIMLIFIVPRFAELFQHSQHSLPLLTQIVIHISDLLRHNGWIVLLPMTGISVFIYYLRHSIPLRHKADAILLKTPLLGTLLNKIILARISRNLAIACAAGLTLMDALKLLSSMTSNHFYFIAIHQLQLDIAKGLQLHAAMQSQPLFPDLMVQMIKIGEESGKLDNMLENIAILYDQEVDQMIHYLKQLLEPLIMIILGVLIGGLVVAMYLPIFKLGTVI